MRKEFKIRLWVRHTECCAFLIVTPWMTSEVTASQTLLLWLNKDPSLLKDAPNLSFIHRSFVFSPRRPWGCIPFFFFFLRLPDSWTVFYTYLTVVWVQHCLSTCSLFFSSYLAHFRATKATQAFSTLLGFAPQNMGLPFLKAATQPFCFCLCVEFVSI